MNKKSIIKPPFDSFVFFTLATIAITAVIVILNTYSALQSKLVLSEAEKNSEEISQALYDIQEHYAKSTIIMTRYAPDSTSPTEYEAYLEQLSALINAISMDFSNQRELVLGYYYQINAKHTSKSLEVFHNVITDTESHISMILGYITNAQRAEIETEISSTGRPVWLTLNQPMRNKYYLSCVAPLFAQDIYIGFAGVVIDSDALKGQYSDMRSEKWRHSFLLSSGLEIFAHDKYAGGERLEYVGAKYLAPLYDIIKQQDSGYAVIKEPDGSGTWIYAFSKMPSGHIYVEAQQRANRVMGTNLLLLQMALIAIIATSLVSKWRTESISVFDMISMRVITNSDEVHPLTTSAYRATLALHVGSLGGAGFRLLYLVISGGKILQIVVCIMALIALLLSLRIYRFKKLTALVTTLFTFSALMIPVFMQLISSALGESLSISSLIWILISVVGSLFLSDRYHARNIFYTFVVVLFAYTLFEVFFIGYPQPELLLPTIGSLIFLGFALFSSVDVYVQNAKANYYMVEHTLTELKDAQSMLIQREKMATLGQLIAGIAHEINTPLGAIKATADTLCASSERIFRVVMEQSRDFSEDDINDLLALMDIVSESGRQMNTTSQIRKAKASVKAFVNDNMTENHAQIADLLIRLEICDMQLLERAKKPLLNPKAVQILKLICDTSPFILGSQTIEYAAARAGKIIFALKSYSHSGISGESAPFDVAQSIETVLTLYQNQLKQNIQVIKEFDEPIPKIMGVVDEISQVWTNIIHNAIQSMPHGGTLTITLHDTRDGFVQARFSDTGTGIPKEYLEIIFEPFFTTKSVGEGTGLGLDISKKIVCRHGGVIDAESEHGEGTTFIVSLPVKKDDNG